MNILNLEHVSKSFENRVLLDDVTLGLEDTDKIGVIGINGTGKSTLLSITAGTLAPDEGKVVRGKEIRISYLSQNPEFDNSLSVLENVARTVNGTFMLNTFLSSWMKHVIPNLIRNLWKVNVKLIQMLSQAQHDGLQFRVTV